MSIRLESICQQRTLLACDSWRNAGILTDCAKPINDTIWECCMLPQLHASHLHSPAGNLSCAPGLKLVTHCAAARCENGFSQSPIAEIASVSNFGEEPRRVCPIVLPGFTNLPSGEGGKGNANKTLLSSREPGIAVVPLEDLSKHRAGTRNGIPEAALTLPRRRKISLKSAWRRRSAGCHRVGQTLKSRGG
jgi:hypothetical protein